MFQNMTIAWQFYLPNTTSKFFIISQAHSAVPQSCQSHIKANLRLALWKKDPRNRQGVLCSHFIMCEFVFRAMRTGSASNIAEEKRLLFSLFSEKADT